jgi:hypothetical protein
VIANYAIYGTVGSAVAALASMINTFRTSRAAKESSKMQNLLLFAQQWNQVYHQDRIDGDVFVAKHPQAELPEWHEESLGNFFSLYRVFGFFELLESGIEFDLIPRKKALEMFIYYFVWWDIACAKANYPMRWDRVGRLKNLRKEMQAIDRYSAICEWVLGDLAARLQKCGIQDVQIKELNQRIRERLGNS